MSLKSVVLLCNDVSCMCMYDVHSLHVDFLETNCRTKTLLLRLVTRYMRTEYPDF